MPKVKYEFNPIIMGIRYHPEDGADIPHMCREIVKYLRSREQVHHQGLLAFIVGDEVGLIEKRPHIHIHFQTNRTEETVRSDFKSFLPVIGDNREIPRGKGNGIYSISVPEWKREEKTAGTVEQQKDRFLRYPLKECGLKYIDICTFPDHWKGADCPEFMARLSQDENTNKERDIEKTKLREEKKEAKKNEIIALMDEIHNKTPFTNTRSILKELIKYYAEERESIDLRHATNKAIFFELRYGLTNVEELANEAINKYR